MNFFTDYLNSLFTQNPAPMGNDYSRQVSLYQTPQGNVFEPASMSGNQLDQLNLQGMLAQLSQGGNERPWELDLLKMLMPQQQLQQKQEEPLAQLKKGIVIPQATLSGLLDPSVALKAYRPTLI
jgi:hypothetical protein